MINGFPASHITAVLKHIVHQNWHHLWTVSQFTSVLFHQNEATCFVPLKPYFLAYFENSGRRMLPKVVIDTLVRIKA